MNDGTDRRRMFGSGDAFAFGLLLLALVSDGFDLQAAGFAAPGLANDWGTTRGALGPALSASLVGVLVGAPALGWLGDRFGRKRAIVLGSVLYALFSFATAAAGSILQFAVLRFLTGVGLGGVLPNVIALTAELAPAHMRRLLTGLVTVGMALGAVVAGLVAASLAESYGWRVLFIVGGVMPLVIAALIAIWLTESPALKPREDSARPSAPATSESLFRGPFLLVTPLLWLLFAGVLMTIFLLTSWLPLVLESGGMAPQVAALMNTLLHSGGVVGGILAGLLLPRLGLMLIPLLIIGALVPIGLLATGALPQAALGGALGLAGICIIGCQTALNASAALIYPPGIRARGVGSALGVGRLGSIGGPMIGGAVIGLGASGTRDLFLVPLVPLGLGLVAAVILVRRWSLGGEAQIAMA